jgi:hypothetical protein
MTAQQHRSNAQLAIERFRSLSNLHEEFGYNSASLKWLDGFIEHQRTTSDFASRTSLIQIIGCYLGECIIWTYGGTWKLHEGQWGVFFDDSNAVFPFAKVSKQFENGHDGGDSISSFFEVIGPIFRKKSGWFGPQ